MKLKFTTWKAPAQFQFQLGIVEKENINYTTSWIRLGSAEAIQMNARITTTKGIAPFEFSRSSRPHPHPFRVWGSRNSRVGEHKVTCDLTDWATTTNDALTQRAVMEETHDWPNWLKTSCLLHFQTSCWTARMNDGAVARPSIVRRLGRRNGKSPLKQLDNRNGFFCRLSSNGLLGLLWDEKYFVQAVLSKWILEILIFLFFFKREEVIKLFISLYNNNCNNDCLKLFEVFRNF